MVSFYDLPNGSLEVHPPPGGPEADGARGQVGAKVTFPWEKSYSFEMSPVPLTDSRVHRLLAKLHRILTKMRGTRGYPEGLGEAPLVVTALPLGPEHRQPRGSTSRPTLVTCHQPSECLHFRV